MVTMHKTTVSNVLSYFEKLDKDFLSVLNKLYAIPGIEIYLSGGSLTIYILNRIKNKDIPIDYIDDIDIFIKVPKYFLNDVVKELTLSTNFYIPLQTSNKYYLASNKFINLKNSKNKLNIIISEDNLKTTLDHFDLNCNKVGLDLTTNEFYYSNTFIDFIDREILYFQIDKATHISLGRFLYKVNQYKLNWDSVKREEIILLFRNLKKDCLFFNLAKKKSAELKEKTKQLIHHLSYLFEDYQINSNGYYSITLRTNLPTYTPSIDSNLLFYQSKNLEF